MGCTLEQIEEFEVTIWDGVPSEDDNIVYQETLNGATTDTGEHEFGSDVYQIDIDLGTVINQTSGFIGVTRKNPSDCTGFGWLAYSGSSVIHQKSGNWALTNAPNELFFCLSYDEPLPFPYQSLICPYISAHC